MANAKRSTSNRKTASRAQAPKSARKKSAKVTPITAAKKRPASRKPAATKKNATREGLTGPDPKLMKKQSGIWNQLMDRYFRLEIDGFDKLPEEPCLLIGVHSGGPLTMDAWTVVMAWWRHFGENRKIHATAHDVLMNSRGLGKYIRRLGVISPSRENIQAAFDKGDDVVLWPGGELDSYRSWMKRDEAVLGGRKGFIRMAMRAGVPIVPVATVGGHDTMFVLSEGRGLAKLLKLKERMRSDVAPITLSWPLGIEPRCWSRYTSTQIPQGWTTRSMLTRYMKKSRVAYRLRWTSWLRNAGSRYSARLAFREAVASEFTWQETGG